MGRPSSISTAGILYLEVEALVLNIGPPSIPAPEHAMDSGVPSKCRKFTACTTNVPYSNKSQTLHVPRTSSSSVPSTSYEHFLLFMFFHPYSYNISFQHALHQQNTQIFTFSATSGSSSSSYGSIRILLICHYFFRIYWSTVVWALSFFHALSFLLIQHLPLACPSSAKHLNHHFLCHIMFLNFISHIPPDLPNPLLFLPSLLINPMLIVSIIAFCMKSLQTPPKFQWKQEVNEKKNDDVIFRT